MDSFPQEQSRNDDMEKQAAFFMQANRTNGGGGFNKTVYKQYMRQPQNAPSLKMMVKNQINEN